MELEGHISDEHVAQAVELLGQQSEKCVIIGCYQCESLEGRFSSPSAPALN
jgi:prephenate dehydratase